MSSGAGCSGFLLGGDGKRQPADFAVPGLVRADELGRYLADVLHEFAMPGNNRVERLG